ncbi:hypothetical protein ES706_05181 [subsurface metagenome]
MRYAVISKGLTISQLQDEVKRCGGRNLRVALASKQVFCDLDEVSIIKLGTTGCSITKVGGVKATVMPPIVTPPTPIAAAPVYSPQQLIWDIGLEDMRSITDPPLYGEGVNLAIIGTGIRETHKRISGHVVYRKNYTTDPMRDGLDHDTGICDIALAVAPLCSILNMKALNDKGEGTEEDVALAIDDCVLFHDTQPDIAPTVINLSLGSPDDGNPNNPLRVACRAAIDKGIWVLASAGNYGPIPYSVTTPACEHYVFAIGSIKYEPFIVSDWSSRGPTLEGQIKPDVVMFGEDISMASSASDTATTAKSGTSFAVPFCSGMVVLVHEGLYRQVIYEEEEIPGVLAPEVLGWVLPAQDVIDTYLSWVCVKPEGAPTGKDYDYGYGLPMASFLYRAVTMRPLLDISTMMAPIMGIAVLGMLGMMITPMVKGAG